MARYTNPDTGVTIERSAGKPVLAGFTLVPDRVEQSSTPTDDLAKQVRSVMPGAAARAAKPRSRRGNAEVLD